ncbi:CLIP domain-containing serine protease 2-like [Maniola jurtina]|uniref:CLIP domain-containing serine protease 2-like n=1 Tax=Maniola jurtina TaxID=191418 RepID=UPI001E68F8BB|nr:CLIP domain-containing serine protease 2-like [Maniola jurtina]
MFNNMLKVLFCVLVLLDSGNYLTFARLCFDCVSITSCQSGLHVAALIAQNLLPLESRQTFFNAICGTDAYDPNIPKVCCSDFPRADARFNLNDLIGITTEIASKEEIEVATKIPTEEFGIHRNLRLLPTYGDGNNACGEIDGSRIFGGKVSKLYEFPWMTLIAFREREGQRFSCGGSIINSRYILTAAHCVITGGVLKNNIGNVRIGDFDYSTAVDCQGDYQNQICETMFQDVDIAEVIPHEDFTGRAPMQADIALLRLNEPINFRNNVAPICLPVYSALRSNDLSGKNATVAGWGATETDNKSTKLLKVDVPILTDDVCGSYYRRYDENMIKNSFCAGELMKDSCGGDSGGPLMMESEFGKSIRLVQFGIVSFGPTQCGSKFPGVYTDVRKYMDWILDNIRE